MKRKRKGRKRISCEVEGSVWHGVGDRMEERRIWWITRKWSWWAKWMRAALYKIENARNIYIFFPFYGSVAHQPRLLTLTSYQLPRLFSTPSDLIKSGKFSFLRLSRWFHSICFLKLFVCIFKIFYLYKKSIYLYFKNDKPIQTRIYHENFLILEKFINKKFI